MIVRSESEGSQCWPVKVEARSGNGEQSLSYFHALGVRRGKDDLEPGTSVSDLLQRSWREMVPLELNHRCVAGSVVSMGSGTKLYCTSHNWCTSMRMALRNRELGSQPWL